MLRIFQLSLYVFFNKLLQSETHSFLFYFFFGWKSIWKLVLLFYFVGFYLFYCLSFFQPVPFNVLCVRVHMCMWTFVERLVFRVVSQLVCSRAVFYSFVRFVVLNSIGCFFLISSFCLWLECPIFMQSLCVNTFAPCAVNAFIQFAPNNTVASLLSCSQSDSSVFF